MIVGEQPGRNEDQQGHPFIGQSGDKINRALKDAGITEFYVTNVSKCFPGKKASTSQMAACKHYLFEEIADVQPEYILALGAAAWRQFGNGKITEAAGKEIRRDDLGVWVMPALHPAAILRDPNREQSWLADIARFGHLVRGELAHEIPYKVLLAKTAEQATAAFRMVAKSRVFSFDFESKPVDWWHKDYIPYTISFGFGTSGQFVVVPLRHSETPLAGEEAAVFLDAIAPYMLDRRITRIAHNRLYDDLVFYRLTGYLPQMTHDTMVMAHLLDENRPKGLKWLGRSVLGWPDWGLDATKEWPLEILARYNGIDSAASINLYSKFRKELEKSPRLKEYYEKVEMPKLQSLAAMIARGIYVDKKKLFWRRVENARAIRERKDAILAVLPPAFKAAVEEKDKKGFNPNSSRQVAKWLYEELQLPILKRSEKTNDPSTDEETVKRLALDHPEVRIILPYRKVRRHESGYFKPLSQMILRDSFDGRYHHDIRSTGTETGRLSSPFHTTPRDSIVRGVFDAPPGCVLIEADYSQIEARLAAWTAANRPTVVGGGSGDSGNTGRMLQAWMERRDVYREQAAECLGKPVADITKDERQALGKVVVLALLYRMQPRGLRDYAWREYEIAWSLPEATRYYAAFHRLWPEFKQWHERVERSIRHRGYIDTEIGRRRRLPAALDPESVAAYEAVNSGINSPVQGLASDLTQTAMICWDQLSQKQDSVESMAEIVGNVHDALLFQAKKISLPDLLPRIKYVMENSWRALKPLGLQLPTGLIQVEIKVGPWGEGKEVAV